MMKTIHQRWGQSIGKAECGSGSNFMKMQTVAPAGAPQKGEKPWAWLQENGELLTIYSCLRRFMGALLLGRINFQVH